MNHTYSSEIPRIYMYVNSRKSPNFKSDFDRWYVIRLCSFNKLYFQHSITIDFKTCFDTKNACLPAIETSIISRLDITLAAPKKQSFDFLDERGKRSRNDKQLTTRSVRHCSRREDDIVTYSGQYSILGSKI